MGSNKGDRQRCLCQAKTHILLDSRVKFIGQSSLYETKPVGVKVEYQLMKFLNAVLIVRSPYSATTWLQKIHRIEKNLSRIRTKDRNAPRTIDIDILFSGNEIIDNDELHVPHPRWTQRRFVVQPLAEIQPTLILPCAIDPVQKILTKMPQNEKVCLFAKKW